MATGYIGKVQIDSGAILPVGSTLFGICRTSASTAAKVIENTEQYPDSLAAAFSPLMDGITIHVKFVNGNTATTGLSLKVGDTLVHDIKNPGGTFDWAAGAVISFTYDGSDWICNDGTVTTINVGNEVAQALAQLDVDNDSTSSVAHHITGFGAGKTLATLTEVDGIIYATFQNISITKSQVSDFPTLGDAAAKGVITSIVESGNGANKTSTDLPTTNAITAYIDNKTAGLTGAMHFVGSTSTTLNDGATTTTLTPKTTGSLIRTTNFEPGDVVLSGDAEYVWNGAAWEILGDESSYALKTNTQDVIKTATFTPDVPGALTTKNTTIPNVTSAGSAATFSVASGVLSITTGTAPTLGTDITIKEVDTWTAGTAASLNTTTQTVVVPGSNS